MAEGDDSFSKSIEQENPTVPPPPRPTLLAFNALLLSYDAYGNFVVQHVLNLNNLRCTYDIAVSLRGHYVELSCTHGGRYIVEKLLEKQETGVLVVAELLECERDKLLRLARSVYGNFVVVTALKVTREDLFRGLVNKLKPLLPLFRSHQSITIAEILESVP
ncbi:BnaA10g29590D [Brassica napus]|uniref:BnaA10g29590D protein n=1 Tax=Brassica napus TaxID=3708 RepID=A0A078K1H6_BRANA|nr:BnaA10g29590D [Brassica napus]